MKHYSTFSIAIASASSHSLVVESSIRKSFSHTLDRSHAKLLVLNNEPTLGSNSIVQYQDGSGEEGFADAVEKSICTRNDVMKRSLVKLSEAGVVLPDSGRAIVQCPSDVDQLCLNLRESDNGLLSDDELLLFENNGVLRI
jgi:hypothetical protein